MGDETRELREGYAEIGDQRLHYVGAGAGPLIVLLHGFPEYWYGWRQQIKPLAAAGFRVVAPDMRGYNLSSKPDGVAAYDTDQLRRVGDQLVPGAAPEFQYAPALPIGAGPVEVDCGPAAREH